jgi:hypothetical protein
VSLTGLFLCLQAFRLTARRKLVSVVSLVCGGAPGTGQDGVSGGPQTESLQRFGDFLLQKELVVF